jgi:hypothetical protein
MISVINWTEVLQDPQASFCSSYPRLKIGISPAALLFANPWKSCGMARNLRVTSVARISIGQRGTQCHVAENA